MNKIKELEEENNELKDKNNELNINCSIINYSVDINNINNGILKQYIDKADDYDKFIKEYITTEYSKDFYDCYFKEDDDITEKINYDIIFLEFKNSYINTKTETEIDFLYIKYFLRALSQQDYKEAQEYALDFLKDNIDNFKEIKEYLNELYEEFIEDD